MHHRHGPKAKAVVERALEITSRLPAPLRRAQMRAILSVLSEPMLALLREASMNPDKIPETPAVRETRLAIEALWRKQVAQGRKRGRIEGEAKGRAEGEVKGKQDALLALLKARGISLSAKERAILRGCADSGDLDRWIVRAATAESAAEVFGADSPSGAACAPRRRPAATRARAARRT